MRVLSLAAIVLVVWLNLADAKAESAPVSLSRVSSWEVNYDVDSCHLRAIFGTGNEKILMDLTRVRPSDTFDLTLYGKKLASSQLQVDVWFAFGNFQRLQQMSALSGASNAGEKLPLLLMPGLRVDNRFGYAPVTGTWPKITPGDESAATSLTIKLSSSKPYRLETGSLAAPFGALRQCTDDLVKSWGYDPTVLAKMTKAPEAVGANPSWLTSNDYPTGALKRGQSGRLIVRLDVDATGKAQGCRVLYRVASDEFANLTCKLILKRAKFTPALDEFGKPIKSYYIRTINWLMSV